MSQEPVVRYGVLGPITVTLDGRDVDLGPPRQRALLALLLTEAGRVVPADRVVELLWRGEPPEQAMGTVHSYVSNLRRALEPSRPPRTPPTTLLTRAPGYIVAIPPGELDAQVFERLAADARTEQGSNPEAAAAAFDEALSLWRGPAYEEFRDELFALGEVRRLDDLRLTCIEDKFDVELALGRHVGLAAELEQAVEAHPLRERLRGQLLLALYRSGRQADALRAYEDGRRRLVDELGLEPGHDLRRLERAILEHDLSVLAVPSLRVAATPAAPPSPAAAVRQAPNGYPGTLPVPARVARSSAFVGRDAELQRLRSAWEWVRGGSARLVAVSGDAGIGKTRLVSELAQDVHDAGGIVLWGRSTPEPLTSYQPFVEALSPLVAGVGLDPAADLGAGRPALARLFPDTPGTAIGSPNPGFDVDRYLLFDAIADLIAAALDEGPALLVLDDMHWADPSTAALLVHVLRTLRARPLLVVSTHRDAEVGPDHQLTNALSDLRRDHLVALLALQGLDEGAASSLVQLLAGAVDADVVAGVQRRTEGNPFFIEEVVSHALDTGDWELEEGRVPKGIRDILERRLNLLPADDQRLLAAAAVIGREFDFELLSEMTGADEDLLVDVVERAARSHLLVEPSDSPGSLSFAHALIREVLLDRTMAVRLRRLHRAAAEAIERTAGPAVVERAGEIAHHLLAAGTAGDAARTAHFLGQAATRSLQVSSYDESIALCRRAIEVLGDAGDPAARLDLLLTLGAALLASGDLEAARATYFSAADGASRLSDGPRLAAAATGSGLGTGVGVSFHPGQVDVERVELLERALLLLSGRDPALEVWVLSYLVVALQDAPDATRRVEASLQAETLAERLALPRLRSAAAIGRRLVLAVPDAPMAERLRVGRVAIDEGDQAGELPLRIVSRLGHLADLVEAGELHAHDRVLAEVEQLVGPLRQRRWHWFVDTARAGRALACGNYAEAEVLIEAALASVGQAQGAAPRQGYALQRLLLERDLGQAERSVERLAARDVWSIGGPLQKAALSLALVASHDLVQAEPVYRRVADQDFAAVAHNQLWLVTMAWLSESAAALGDLDGCRVLHGLLAGKEDRLVAVGGGGCAGSVARVQGLLAGALGDDQEALARHQQALAVHERLGLDPWVARSSADLAGAWRRLGDDGSADAASAAAHDLAARLGLHLDPPFSTQ